ncbi:MAG TPA: hypothetical protein PLM72_02660 [Spirochaetota bacterium]|nr:hypothetical protein [Spirochaetota bacterium]
MSKHICIFVIIISLLSCSNREKNKSNDKDLFSRTDISKTADLDIESNNPDELRSNVYKKLPDFNAMIISEEWNNRGKSDENGNMIILLPSSDFMQMIEWIKDNYPIDSINMRAGEFDINSYKEDAEKKNLINKNIAYSQIHLDVVKTKSLLGCFFIGCGEAKTALEYSLQTVVPVILFLLPYALVIISLILIIKFILRKLKRKIFK